MGTLEKNAQALEVPIYQFFYDGDEPRKKPAFRLKPVEEDGWGSKGKEGDELRRFAKLLSRLDDRQRQLIFMALGMARKRARRRRGA